MEKILVAGGKGVVKKKPKVRSVRYAECDRNHAVKDGGYVVDGCKEFIASDENGGSPLTCSCCGCHRNFHRIVEETDQEGFGVEEQKEKKKRKLKSKVWDDFTKCTDKDGNEWAVCKRCEEKFDGSSKKGTTHLKNHLMSKICQIKRKGDGDDENEDTSTQGDGDDENEESCVIDLIDLNFDEGFWGPSVTNSFALALPLSPQSPVMLRKYSPFDIF